MNNYIPKVGDKVMVYNGLGITAKIESVKQENNSTTVLHLDWAEHGKSKVYLHDIGKVWNLAANIS